MPPVLPIEVILVWLFLSSILPVHSYPTLQILVLDRLSLFSLADGTRAHAIAPIGRFLFAFLEPSPTELKNSEKIENTSRSGVSVSIALHLRSVQGLPSIADLATFFTL